MIYSPDTHMPKLHLEPWVCRVCAKPIVGVHMAGSLVDGSWHWHPASGLAPCFAATIRLCSRAHSAIFFRQHREHFLKIRFVEKWGRAA